MRKGRGFTIIEVLISAVVMSLLILVAFSILDIGRGSWFSGDVQSELRKEMIRGFMSMERELREIRPISAYLSLNYGESSNAVVFNIPQDSADSDTTVLDNFGEIEWSGNITYSLNGNNEIIRTAPDGTTKVLARGITNLEFSRDRGAASPLPLDLLIINIAAQKASGIGRIATESGQLIVRMRN
jgi:prepilin-type N-terminal cleavage/methylation domain-containing protein